MDIVIYTWVPMMVASFLVIPLVQFLRAHPNSWTAFKRATIAYVALQVFLFGFVTYRALTYRLPPASGLIVTCECARLSMKMHAYVREKVVHGLRHHYKALLASGGGATGVLSTPVSPAAGAAARTERGGSASATTAAVPASATSVAQASERKEATVSPTAASLLTPMASSEVSPASAGSGAPSSSASGTSTSSAPGDAPAATSSAPNSARSVDVGASAAASTAATPSTPTVAGAGKPAVALLQVETFQERLERFANFLPAAAARAGVEADSLRASQPGITIGDTNEEIGRCVRVCCSARDG